MRVRAVAVVSSVATACAIVFAVVATGTGDRERAEASLFLERFQAIDIEDPLVERRERIEAIARSPISTEEIDAIRDACVAAHRTMIHAEDSSAAARAHFEQATAGNPGAHIPTEVQASIELALSESNDALERAREQLPRCEDRVRSLEVRFSRRRR
jgi:hypothetical protein